MNHKNRYLFILIFILTSIFTACEKEGGLNRRTGFDVPELTESNTIQFTATVQAGGYVYFMLDGGKVAVDWGDGKVTKDIEPGKGDYRRMEFSHAYKERGEFRIKIWSDEVTNISISSLMYSYEQLHVGNCPALKTAMFNSFTSDKSLNLNGCPNLKIINIGNWDILETIDIKECSQLKTIMVYTNPNLKALDVSHSSTLYSLDCFDCGVEELKLPQDVTDVNIRNNNLKSLSLTDYKNLSTLIIEKNKNLTTLELDGCDNLYHLNFVDTKIETFDFSSLPELGLIFCSNTKMTELDVSSNKKLGSLECTGLGLTSLDITDNAWLQQLDCRDNELTTLDITNNPMLAMLDCSDNKLTALDVSKNTEFRYLFINDNELNKENLETIFSALPRFGSAMSRSLSPPPSPSEIKIHGNPGAGTCNTKIITNKGWVIIAK